MQKINSRLNKQLLDIYQKTIQLEDLNFKIKKILPHHLQEHCMVGSFNKACLVLVTTSAIFATELRYLLPDLRDTLRQQKGFYQLASIKIEIVSDLCLPNQNMLKKKKIKRRALTQEVQQTLQEAAGLVSYEPLKEIFLRMAGEGN